MKHIIALLFFGAAFAAVLYVGFWNINEQRKQYEYNQRNGISNAVGGELVSDDDVQVSGTDPFGLFGPDEMTYKVSVVVDWSSRSHEGNYPNSAHLSQPVFWTGSSNPVFAIEQNPSEGMKEFSVSGRTRALKQELESFIENETISQFDIKDRIDAPGSDSYEVTLTREDPVFSLISKLAPSPDWFLALEGVNMLEDNRWKDNVRVSMVALDGGVSGGNEFKNAINEEGTDQFISPLTDIRAVALPPFAYITFKQVIK